MTVDVLALIRRAAAASLNAQAEVAQRAARDLAPKDTRALVESIKVTEATTRDLTAQVFSNAEHALFIHEGLDLQHPNGGRAKFMEAAVEAERAPIVVAGAAAARRALS